MRTAITTNEFKDIYDSLVNESGSNAKMDILKSLYEKEKDHIMFRIFYYTYNSFMQFNIKKIKVQKSDIMKRNNFINEDFFDLLDRLSRREITGNKAKDEVSNFLSQYTEEVQQILIKVIQKNMKIGVSETSINKVLPKNHKYRIPVFKVQLANKVKLEKHFKPRYFISRKLDGIRGIAFKDSAFNIFKRSGKIADGLEHLSDALDRVNKEYNRLYNEDIEFVDGELYSNDIHFSEIQGTVSKSKNYSKKTKEVINMNIFAVGTKDMKTTYEMVKTLNRIEDIIKNNNISSLSIVEQRLVEFTPENFKEKLAKINAEFVAEGYEGIMLRDPDCYYEWKRGNALLKYKEFFENDFKVIDMEEGDGNFRGTLGALVCEGTLDNKKINFKVGTGFSEEERKLMFENRNDIIGKVIEVKYQEVSKDQDGNFSLRFPVFMKIKNDR